MPAVNLSAEPAAKPSGAKTWVTWLPWLIALFILESVVFYARVATQISPFYPTNFDQTSYLDAAYRLFEQFRVSGWSVFYRVFIDPLNGSGAAVIAEGALLAVLGGPNRTALLSLNLLHFMALQLILFRSVHRRLASPSYAWIAVALLLACRTIFNEAGGIFDFRFDFPAACIYGIWICLITDSRIFRDVRGILWISAVAGLLIATRYVAVLYVANVSLALMALLLFRMRRGTHRISRGLAAWRAKNLLVSSILPSLIAIIVLIPAFGQFYTKYFIMSVLNDEKYMRAQEAGIYSLLDNVFFYPRSVLVQHIGAPALELGVFVVLTAFFAAYAIERTKPRRAFRRLARFGYEFAVLAFAVAIPLLLLTLDPSKSAVVAGVVVVPVVIAMTLFGAAVWPEQRFDRHGTSHFTRGTRQLHHISDITSALRAWRPSSSQTLGAIGTLLITAGVATFLIQSTSSQYAAPRADLLRINELSNRIVNYALENEIAKPQFSIDRIVDYLFPGSLDVTAVERFGTPLQFRSGLGFDSYGFNGAPRDVALKLVQQSDIMVLTDPVLGRDAPYPMNTKIAEYWNELAAWTKQNRVALISTEILGIPHRAFVKPLIRLQGISAGWITSAGVTISLSRDDISRWPLLILEGDMNPEILGGIPHLRTVALDAKTGQSGLELPSTLKLAGSRYEITIDTRPLTPDITVPIKIALTFDRFFVPKRLGINADTRELVMLAPETKELVAPSADQP